MPEPKNTSRQLLEDTYEELGNPAKLDTVLNNSALFIQAVQSYRAAVNAKTILPPENTPCGKTPDEWILDQGARLKIDPKKLG
jgi:hypothetical protein